MDGTISCTLELSANPNLVPPFIWWKPFETIGKYPAHKLAMTHLLNAIMQLKKITTTGHKQW